MKSNFKNLLYILTIFLFSTISLSRETFLVTFSEHKQRAKNVEKILMNHFSIPKELIHTQKVDLPCKKLDEAIIQICISENKEMNFPYINREILNRSLKILWEKNEKIK